MRDLIKMSKYVAWINSMTTTELCRAMPKEFIAPVWNGDQDEYVKLSLGFEAKKWIVTKQYMQFLWAPLELGMFIPCDKDGNVLSEPKNWSKFIGKDYKYSLECKQYQEAKERVLFEGCKIVDGNCIKINESTYLVKDVLRLYKTIEDLTQLGLTLTDKAIDV